MAHAVRFGHSRQDWRLDFSQLQADASTGRAHWDAFYRFSVNKRLVHNIVEAEFTFTPEGLIASHRDAFDFWRWSRQALGLGGWVLGWTPFSERQVSQQVRANLERRGCKKSASGTTFAMNPEKEIATMMARYKPQDHNSLMLPVVLSEQIVTGSFAVALNYLVDHELDLSVLDAQFKNDAVGASAYDPRVLHKIVLLA